MNIKIKKIIKKIKKDGFAVIENLISKRECERLKLILEKDYKIYHKRYIYPDNKKNGSTLLVPKSHKVKKYVNNKRKIKNKKLINAKQGSALIFNGNLWHGGSEKTIMILDGL